MSRSGARFEMSDGFPELACLASLISPVTETEFRTVYWEKKPLIIHRGSSGYYSDIFSVADFDRAVARTPEFVTLDDSRVRHSTTPGARLTSEAALAALKDGGALVLDRVDRLEAKLGALCRKLESEIGHRLHARGYLTAPNGRPSAAYAHNDDVFALQIFGHRHWRLERTPRGFPVREHLGAQEFHEVLGDLDCFTLEQGDFAYIPRGYVHAAECGSKPSLHINLLLIATFFDDVLHAAINFAARDDATLRAALPVGFLHDRSGSLLDRVATALSNAANKEFLAAVIDQYFDELVTTFPAEISGQIGDFVEPRPVMSGDIVGPRPGSVYRIHFMKDTARLNFGGRTITFPAVFGTALKFALNTPVYAVKDIPGELQDEERLVFIERLLQEGIVIRK
jgi:ribosomal protein L16 Arg81 hydroxylase